MTLTRRSYFKQRLCMNICVHVHHLRDVSTEPHPVPHVQLSCPIYSFVFLHWQHINCSFRSLSTHPNVDGMSSDVSLSTARFWSLIAQQLKRMGTCFKIKKKNVWWLQTARLVRSKSLEALIPPMDLESCCSSHPGRTAEHEHPLQAGCMLMLRAQQLNWRLTVWPPKIWIMPDKAYAAILHMTLIFIIGFITCKTSPHLFQLFRRMLQHCFPLFPLKL